MTPVKVCLIPLKSGYFSTNNSLACDALAGHLEWCFGEGVDVAVQDHRFMNDDELIHNLKQRKPHVIGLSTFIGSMEYAENLIQRIRETFSLNVREAIPSVGDSLILVGNLLGTFAYKDILDIDAKVVCVRGHGEIALQQICDVLLRHRIQSGNGLSPLETLHQNGISKIRNLAYKEPLTQEVITTKRIPSLPSQVGPTKYTSIHDVIARGGSIDVRTSYGCTGYCTFCSVRALNGTKDYHTFHPKRVVDEFRYIYQQGYRKAICITDDNFWGRSLDQMEELIVELESLKQEVGERIPFKISARADNAINPKDTPPQRARRAKLWRRLVDVGLDGVFIGFESNSAPQLRRYGKGIKKDVNYQAYRFLTDKLGIRVEMGFIAIDPLMGDEWRQTMRENIAFVKATRMYEYSPAFISEMRALEGTSYLQMLEKRNLKRNLIPGTLEYDYEYLNPQVKEFVAWIEPFFSTRKADSNPYYMLKNTLKVMKRNEILSQELFELSNMLAFAEIDFVEGLLDLDFKRRWVGKFLQEQCAMRIGSILDKMKEAIPRETKTPEAQVEKLNEALRQAIKYLENHYTVK